MKLYKSMIYSILVVTPVLFYSLIINNILLNSIVIGLAWFTFDLLFIIDNLKSKKILLYSFMAFFKIILIYLMLKEFKIYNSENLVIHNTRWLILILFFNLINFYFSNNKNYKEYFKSYWPIVIFVVINYILYNTTFSLIRKPYLYQIVLLENVTLFFLITFNAYLKTKELKEEVHI